MAALPDRIVAWAERLPPRVRPVVLLAVRTVKDSIDDRIPGLAAEVAFYTILSLPPLLLTIVATLGVLGEDIQRAAITQIEQVTRNVLTPDAAAEFTALLERVFERSAVGLVSLGSVLTLFTASRAMRVLTVAISIAYDLEDRRPGWMQFLYGLGLTLGTAVVAAVVVPLLVAGPRLGERIAAWFGLRELFATVWSIAYWPVAGLVAVLLLALLYHVAAPWWTPYRRDVPGAVLAAVGILLGSLGLRVYAQRSVASDALFGPLAAPLVLLLWLYVVALAVLVGAELNAEVERMWPTGAGGGEASTPHTSGAAAAPSRAAAPSGTVPARAPSGDRAGKDSDPPSVTDRGR